MPPDRPASHPAGWPQLAARAIFLAGLLLVLAAMPLAWFGVPALDASGRVVLEGSGWTWLFRGVALAAALGAAGTWHRPGLHPATARFVGAALAIIAFFPAALTWGSAPLFARAQWLQTQHENLTWLGGDLFTSQESILSGEYLSLAMVDAPRGSNIIVIPKSVPALVQVGRLSDLVSWLGYTNGFCLCVRPGWFAAVGGLAALLLGLLRRERGLKLGLFRQAVKSGAGVAAIGLAGLLVPLLLAGSLIGRAHREAVAGRPAAAHRLLERAAGWMPLIREDTFFVVQAGLLDVRAGHESPMAELFRIVAAEEAGHDHQAELGFAGLLTDSPRLPAALRREARRGLLRAAVSHFNAGRNEAAIRTLTALLADDPLDLKALLTLHRAHARARDWTAAAAVADRYRALYLRLNTVTRQPALAAVDLPRALAAAVPSP